jgi:hypothetical protein
MITFIKKYHTCSSCSSKDYELFAIARLSDLSSGYPADSKPESLKEGGVYIEKVARDDYGIILYKRAEEKPCQACGKFALVADRVDNETPVSNFYPQTEAHKWLDGLAKSGV